MRTRHVSALAGLSLLLACLPVKGVGLVLSQGLPDLTGSYMNVSYQAGSSFFQAVGYTTAYTDAQTNLLGVTPNDLDYLLTANITSSGNLTNGALSIKGDLNALGYDTNLLTGTLITGASGVAYGYGDGLNQIFQFRFNVTGGILASAFGGIGSEGGIILDAQFSTPFFGDTPFTGSWASSFNNNGTMNGNIDSFASLLGGATPLPEPTSIALMAFAGFFFMVHRYRKKQQRNGGIIVDRVQ